ncbi:hypothetical protein [Streptomyces sp. NPDC052114]|uniref:hypothetical protein n=1 Tax=unclassified Streptomyces TaxID=2593676 RepID=UPI00341B21EE
MPRSTTTSALLVSVAVSAAVSGCVSVEQPSGPRPAAATVSPPGPHPDGKDRPQNVQAPAREVLQRMDPPHRAAPPSTASETRPALPPPRTPHPPAPPVRRPAPSRPDAGATRPAPARTTPGSGGGPAARPDTGTDVCALGEAYGNWRPDSPQAVICRDTYGR